MGVDRCLDELDVVGSTRLGRGSILVDPSGVIKIIRSRNGDDTGWNCADGAGIDDAAASDPDLWRVYTPERLAADLALATEVRNLGGLPELRGGLATWDACSGRPCVLPKIARLIR